MSSSTKLTGVYTDTSYRERLRELYKVRYLDVPITFLTATLPPRLEPAFSTLFMLSAIHTVLYRQPTWRSTIQYRVIDSRGRPTLDIVARMMQEIKLQPGQRGVVFIRDYATCKKLRGTLAEAGLEVSFYLARSDEKSDVLSAWVKGSGGWIIATGALGMGH